ncbi:MAG: hypothetical protein CL840_14610 [Crocinitomicaceae bacterium]|nr:hypothetical protein [Crocinitomicaceae bacterium]|tara:strand:- start:1211 stop:1594 length:384 start_codon:yes stop_codon:yes gene_type:complete
MQLIKPRIVHIKVFRNKIEVIDFKSGKTKSVLASRSFSSKRLLIADFHSAEATMKKALDAVIPIYFGVISPSLDVFIQAMEIYNGGLSMVEVRTFVDSAEHCGAKRVVVRDGSKFYSANQVIKLFNQ